MHHSTLRINNSSTTMLSSLILYDCFISMPQLGQLATGVLIQIDSTRTVSVHVHNLKLPLPVSTLSECCSPKRTLSSSLSYLVSPRYSIYVKYHSTSTHSPMRKNSRSEYRRPTKFNCWGSPPPEMTYPKVANLRATALNLRN